MGAGEHLRQQPQHLIVAVGSGRSTSPGRLLLGGQRDRGGIAVVERLPDGLTRVTLATAPKPPKAENRDYLRTKPRRLRRSWPSHSQPWQGFCAALDKRNVRVPLVDNMLHFS